MAFHIRSAQADQLLRKLQNLTGESLTEAVSRALAERLERETLRKETESAGDPLSILRETWERLAEVPNRDPRPDEEILGYGPDGMP